MTYCVGATVSKLKQITEKIPMFKDVKKNSNVKVKVSLRISQIYKLVDLSR